MPTYPYRCKKCDTRWSIKKARSKSDDLEACPECGLETNEQDYSQKRVGGFVSSEGAWSTGKLVPQLGVRHPDRMVTSQSEMEKVYRKHGISLDTGHFTSKEAQIKATVPRKQRLGVDPSTINVSGVIEEK